MTASAATIERWGAAGALPTLVMAGAAANGLAVRVIEALSSPELPALSLGISPFQLVVLFVAARLSVAGERGPARPLADVLALVLLLLPSSAVAWFALLLYAGLRALETRDEARAGALLFAGLAAAALWSSVVLKWMAGPVTSLEASAVASLLAILRPDLVQLGNVIGNPDGHSLILMTRCTTADALPMCLVSMLAVARLLGPTDVRTAALPMLGVAAAFATLNLARLCAMAWSAEAYELVHGAVGANLFDAAQVALVLLGGSRAVRP